MLLTMGPCHLQKKVYSVLFHTLCNKRRRREQVKCLVVKQMLQQPELWDMLQIFLTYAASNS